MRNIEFYIIIMAIHFDIIICVGKNNSNLWSNIKVREAQFKKTPQMWDLKQPTESMRN